MASRDQIDKQKPASSDRKLIQNQEIIRSRAVATKSCTCAEIP
jgi:hypothetical protein